MNRSLRVLEADQLHFIAGGAGAALAGIALGSETVTTMDALTGNTRPPHPYADSDHNSGWPHQSDNVSGLFGFRRARVRLGIYCAALDALGEEYKLGE